MSKKPYRYLDVIGLTQSVKIILELSPIIIALIGIIVNFLVDVKTYHNILISYVIIVITLIFIALLIFATTYQIKSNRLKIRLLSIALFLTQTALLVGVIEFAIFGIRLFGILFVILAYLFLVTNIVIRRKFIKYPMYFSYSNFSAFLKHPKKYINKRAEGYKPNLEKSIK